MNESNPKIESSDQRPWTVIVREGLVVGRYRAEDSYATDADVSHVALGNSQEEVYEVYEVDARMPLPPEVGKPVTAEDLRQWTQAKAKSQGWKPQPEASAQDPGMQDPGIEGRRDV